MTPNKVSAGVIGIRSTSPWKLMPPEAPVSRVSVLSEEWEQDSIEQASEGLKLGKSLVLSTAGGGLVITSIDCSSSSGTFASGGSGALPSV